MVRRPDFCLLISHHSLSHQLEPEDDVETRSCSQAIEETRLRPEQDGRDRE